MSIDRRVDKEVVVHMYNGILAVKSNAFESVDLPLQSWAFVTHDQKMGLVIIITKIPGQLLILDQKPGHFLLSFLLSYNL